MKQSRFMSLIMLSLMGLGCSGMTSGNAQAESIRSGRSIQLDGFLIDWQEKTRHQWAGSATWFWDAAATPEGVAGYFTNQWASCSSWTMYVVVRGLSRPSWEMKASKGNAHSDWYRTRFIYHDGVNAITLEWLIPWDSLAVDSCGAYAIHIAGYSDCGDSLASLHLTGNIHALTRKISLLRMFAVRLIVIAILLGFFIGLQFVDRQKTRRRGSLRRSA
ncbi:MAG: hypothetical protein ABSE00_04630 [Chitinispirillaceae bacterium]|jgi:hypothetical protein